MLRWWISSAALVAACVASASAQIDEEFVRRQYESGRTFMQNRRYTEAMKDFQAVVASFPKSVVADDALLQIALYQIDIARDLKAAQEATDRLLKDYAVADSAPMGHVVAGRLAMARGRTGPPVDEALAAFERVPRLFPGADAVPAATFYSGDTLRLAGRFDEALDRFRRVAMEYPRSIWVARARLAEALSLVQSDRAPRALLELQRVRSQFPGTPEADTALNYNTILYRLYVRAPAQPTHSASGRYLGGEAAKFRDVVGIALDDGGRVLVGHRLGVSMFDAKGALQKTMSSDEPSAFFVDERGRVVVARRNMLTAEAAETVSVLIPIAAQPRLVEEIPSVLALSNGDRIVADRKGKVVIRMEPAGKVLGTFASIDADRLTRDALDNIAIIEHDTKTVIRVDRDGKVVSRIPPKGAGYQFANPVDLAFDAAGHLYVLDRDRASIIVFNPKNKLIATLALSEAGVSLRPEAFALDAAGRVYVFDERTQRIQVYQ